MQVQAINILCIDTPQNASTVQPRAELVRCRRHYFFHGLSGWIEDSGTDLVGAFRMVVGKGPSEDIFRMPVNLWVSLPVGFTDGIKYSTR